VPAPVILAYVIVSLVWGSTYLAIRIGVQHLPPALFGGTRFLTAGLLLLVVALLLRKPFPRRPRDWRTAAVVGVMLLSVGNGLVIWSEQYIESGLAAVLVMTGALWMALLDAVIPGSERRPTPQQFVGLGVGFAGAVWLALGDGTTLQAAGVWPALALLAATFSWAAGSIYSKRHPVETGPYVHAALQMCVGGAVLAVTGVVTGEAARFEFSRAGLLAVAYLILFGSIVAYTSYVYLLKHAQPTFLGTHVYVNTCVAVLLGWLVLDERLSVDRVAAMAVVIGSVIWVRQAERSAARRLARSGGGRHA
jgi:drug/metabolite transporter (DMT)-like permease